MAVKYSRQRQMIYNFLMTRKDHPTADVVYRNVREEFPNISLGTVYRNLTDTSKHCHFICSNCSAVTDMQLDCLEELLIKAQQTFDGRIDRQSTCFYGVCGSCLDKSAKDME